MDLSTMLHSQCKIQGRIGRSVKNLKKLGISNITLSANENPHKDYGSTMHKIRGSI